MKDLIEMDDILPHQTLLQRGMIAEPATRVIVPAETAAPGSGLVALLVEERALIAVTARTGLCKVST